MSDSLYCQLSMVCPHLEDLTRSIRNTDVTCAYSTIEGTIEHNLPRTVMGGLPLAIAFTIIQDIRNVQNK